MSIVPNYITNSGGASWLSTTNANTGGYLKNRYMMSSSASSQGGAFGLATITLSTVPSSTYAHYKTDLGSLSDVYNAYYNNYITAPKLLLDPDTTGKYDTIDNSGNLLYKWDPLMRPNPNLNDAMSADTQTLLVQQNTMYIIGIITCITLIITAIMLSSSR